MRPSVRLPAVALDLVRVVPTVPVHVIVQWVANPVRVVVGRVGQGGPWKGPAGLFLRVRPSGGVVLPDKLDVGVVIVRVDLVAVHVDIRVRGR